MASNINVVAGGVYSMPPGYYSDDITITTPTLSSLTQATAGVADIRKGKTAWVNGKKSSAPIQVPTVPYSYKVQITYVKILGMDM